MEYPLEHVEYKYSTSVAVYSAAGTKYVGLSEKDN